jgi:pyridoxine kinase
MKYKYQKRVMAINDISCFGKCSLTVALPIISACGAEVCPLMTSVLSTHTGGFKDYYFEDMSSSMEKITEHWQKENIKFDVVYSGYLGSNKQVEQVSNIIELFSHKDLLVVVDPVMGDSGKLYSGFNKEYVSEIKKLCVRADIITPNLTEACFLTDIPYQEGVCSKEYIEKIIDRLSVITKGCIILTGVDLSEKEFGAAVYTKDGGIEYILSEKIDGTYHGTGDVFASSFIGDYIVNKNISEAATTAVNFTVDCIRSTKELYGDIHYGVNFEENISKLLSYIKR